MQLFISKYINDIDTRGRVAVPVSYRNLLENENCKEIVLYPSFKNKCIEASSIKRFEHITKIIQNLDPFCEERDAFETIVLGESAFLSFEQGGRVVIPSNLKEYAQIDKQICFIGKGSFFELWNPNIFDEHLLKVRSIAHNHRSILKNIELK